MRSSRLSILCFVIAAGGCHFAVQGVGVGGSASDPLPDPTTGSTGSTPSTPDPPDLSPPDSPGSDAGSPTQMPTGGKVGDTCDATHPCSTGLDCDTHVGGPKGLDFPNGYCTVSCNNTACPSGSVCTDLDKQKFCLAACGGPAGGCAGGNHCCDVGGSLVCVSMSCGGPGPGPQ